MQIKLYCTFVIDSSDIVNLENFPIFGFSFFNFFLGEVFSSLFLFLSSFFPPFSDSCDMLLKGCLSAVSTVVIIKNNNNKSQVAKFLLIFFIIRSSVGSIKSIGFLYLCFLARRVLCNWNRSPLS